MVPKVYSLQILLQIPGCSTNHRGVTEQLRSVEQITNKPRQQPQDVYSYNERPANKSPHVSTQVTSQNVHVLGAAAVME